MNRKVEAENSRPLGPTEGPFVFDLTRPVVPGSTTEGRFRYILGGGEGARKRFFHSMEQIGQIDASLGFADVRKAASAIFRENGLVRVDF